MENETRSMEMKSNLSMEILEMELIIKVLYLIALKRHELKV